MSTPPPEPLAPEEVAAAHQAQQAALRLAAIGAILQIWDQMDPFDLFGSWWRGALGMRIFTILSLAQETVAAEAPAYVKRVLEASGQNVRVPIILPSSFAGVASDGRNLEDLLAGAPITTLERIRRGQDRVLAMQSGRAYLSAVVSTQISDAARGADQTVIVGTDPVAPSKKRTVYGYVRQLQPPSCSRCIVLAGRFYKWNEGFLRHINCDCRHIPIASSDSNDLLTDSLKYFKSLTKRQQELVFGQKNAQAIRDGADISRVVNSVTRGKVYVADGRQGTRVGTGRRSGVGFRPTVWQIYRDAAGDRDKARQLLRQFGYILQ